jgi:ABC-type antimicrobial peptide transport system permease subunit
MSKSPSKYILKFFRWFCHPDYVEDIEGDLLERFEKRTSEKRAARWLFMLDVLKLFRPGIIRNFEGTKKLNYYGMFKHNLKVSYRNLLRRKSYAFINIGGLVLGLTIALLITLWIRDELSYNKMNDHYDQIARVIQNQTVNGRTYSVKAMPFPLHIELENMYGDDFEAIVPATWFGDYVLSKDETVITTRGGFMGSDAPELMSIQMLKGNRKGLAEESAVLISASTARALFGNGDPLGKIIKVHNQVDLNVTGVFEDIPTKSSFHGVTFIGNWGFYVAMTDWINKTAWNDNSFQLFVQLSEHANLEAISEKITRIKYDNTPPEKRLYDTKVFLHPMKDWHLRSHWENGIQTGGAIQYVWWFGIIGAFVLLLACVNFMNLSTAQSIRRTKEVGVRKAIGTSRNQIALQFLTESMLIAFIAFLIASTVTFLVLPYFNILTNKEIVLQVWEPAFWLGGLGFAFVTGLISGSYPALYLSSFNAIQALKGTFQTALSAVFFRKTLVVFQFTISVILIIGTIIISEQINYAAERPLGYDYEGTISVEMTSDEHYAKSDVLRNELLASDVVTHFTQSSAPLTEVWNENDGFSWEGMDPSFNPMFCTFFVNHSFGQTIDWNILSGRDFSFEYAGDSSAMIINEAALIYMQLDDPINKKIRWFKDFRIIGVVKDLLVESPFSEVRPAVYVINPSDLVNFILVKLNPQIHTLKALEQVETIFEANLPKVPFDFKFVSDVHDKKSSEINRIATICQLFAVLAILISCLGLFGLTSFMVEQRSKEISIRKILGAPLFTLWQLLSREFITLVTISCAIAIPIAFFGSQEWLENYEYRTPIRWWVFLLSCLITLIITIFTISSRSIRVAKTNPAESLKDE